MALRIFACRRSYSFWMERPAPGKAAGKWEVPVKKLYKSSKNRYICGVCGGIAEYFQIDATLVRLVAAALCVIGGSGILLYLAAAFIMPGEPEA